MFAEVLAIHAAAANLAKSIISAIIMPFNLHDYTPHLCELARDTSSLS